MQTPPDHQQRLQALDPSCSFIVQAPAGSGKTELLTQRYLVLLAQAKYPEEIIAITFTRKAAAEMRARVVAALQRAQKITDENDLTPSTKLAQAVLKRDQTAGWHLLDNPNQLQIQTIDALCASITRQMPILSHFGAQPEITDKSATLYSQAAREVLASLEDDSPWSEKLATLLLHLDNDYAKVEKLFCEMLARRDQWLPHIIGIGDIHTQRASLEQGLQRAITETYDKLRTNLSIEQTHEILSLLSFSREQLNLAPASEQSKWSHIVDLLITKDRKGWRKTVDKRQGFPTDTKNPAEKQLFKTMKSRHAELINQLSLNKDLFANLIDVAALPPPTYNENQWRILVALLELLPILAAQLRVLFQEHNAVDFIEVAHCALQALNSVQAPTDLALKLDYKIQHILVDEFQDTSYIQMRLLEQLTAGWQSNDGRTLFLVGDPMQSIYRFRKADVGLFLQARHYGIGAVNLIPLTLSVNFRSTHNVVDWINQHFKHLMPQQENIGDGAIPFTPSIANKASEDNSNIVLHSLTDDNAAPEAQIVVSIINNTQAQDPQAKIAILVRARTHLTEILPALAAAGINYRAVEIESLQTSQTIQDLLSLTRALLHPADRIAWLAVLRAPWCGLTLADLHQIASQDLHRPLWELLQNTATLNLPAASQQRLTRTLAVLNNSLQQRQRLPLAHWVQGTWEALGGPACIMQMNDLADAKTFFDLLGTAHTPDIAQIEQRLQALYATPNTTDDNCVEIMTIHKSKGLEFDCVILPGLERDPPNEKKQLLFYMERATNSDQVDLLLGPIKASEQESDPIYDYLNYEEQKRARYEMLRLLYVATTRAKKSLHLIANLKRVDDEIKKPTSNSLLGLLWPTLETEFLKSLSPVITNPTAFAGHDNPDISETPQQLRRLQTTWTLPPTAAGITPTFNLHEDLNTKYKSHYVFPPEQDNTARHIGTLTHRILCQISTIGLNNWETKKIAQQDNYLKSQLLTLGVLPNKLADAIATTKIALEKTLQDPRGRWILDNEHQAAHSEYPLSAVLENEIISVVIDRTFIDKDGIRWIIDYKTANFSGDSLDNFLDAEAKHYREQLENYAIIMSMQETRRIKLGLYFPLLNGWREWEYTKTEK